jgi:cobalt-zinc-cadmium efflux system membrane fusion protein
MRLQAWRLPGWAAPAGLIAVLAASSCATKQAAGVPAETQSQSQSSATLFQVPQNQLAQLRIVQVHKAVWSPAVHTTGTVDWDADQTTQAITQVNGPISRLLVDTGAVVAADQPLLYVASPDVASAVATYKKARNHLDFARKTLDRSKDLLDHKVIAQKDLEAAEQDYNDASAEVENDLQALKIFGVTQQEIDQAQNQGVAINPQLAVRSPIAGVIVQKLVTPGLVIQAGTTACFTISDMSTVWVWGHIYDRDLEAVRIGDTVELTNAGFHQTFSGTVNYIGSLLDPATRTTPVRIVTKNTAGLLKKDLFVDAVIHTKSGHGVLAVPTSAILRTDDNLPFVYVEVEPGKFAQRLVTIGVEMGAETELVGGVKEHEKIVAEGALFLQFANSIQ